MMYYKRSIKIQVMKVLNVIVQIFMIEVKEGLF